MNCPLCDKEIGDDLISHFNGEHKEITYACQDCYRVYGGSGTIGIRSFKDLVRHCHTEEHLMSTGKLKDEIKKREEKEAILKQQLAEQVKRTIAVEAEKIEILQAGSARR